MAAYRASHKKPTENQTVGKSAVSPGEIHVFMNGAVGNDDAGRELCKKLEENGVDTTGVDALEVEKTGHVSTTIDKVTRNSSHIGFKGANALFKPREDNVKGLAGGTKAKPDLFVTRCTLDTTTVEQMLKTSHNSGVETILRASPAVYLPSATYSHVTHLVFNQHEAAEMSNQVAKDFEDLETVKTTANSFIKKGARYTVISLADKGTVYATHEGITGHISAEKDMDVKDTTGASSSFVGAYAVEVIRQKGKGEFDIERAIAFSLKAVVMTETQVGPQTALPWADEIERK